MNLMIYNLFLREINISPGLIDPAVPCCHGDVVVNFFLFQVIFVFPVFQIHSPKNKGKTKINWNRKLTAETFMYFSFGQLETLHLFAKLLVTCIYRVFSLTWPPSMQIYGNKRKRLHKKRVQLPEDWFGTPTWPPFHCFGTPIWPPWRHVKTLYISIAFGLPRILFFFN